MLQPKLLQVIEEQEFTPIGSEKVEKVDVRIIASTNRDLKEMIREGRFREDLYYRLCVMALRIPPLSERQEDVSLLIRHYLDFFAEKHQRRVELNAETLQLLTSYRWPGNVRELKHLLEYLTVVTGDSLILPEHLPPHITAPHGEGKVKTLPEILDSVESDLVLESYRQWGSSYKVARHLGISQSSAVRKIRKYLGSAVS